MASIFNTDVEPSRLCLGTAGYGSGQSKDQAFEVMDAFMEAGGNFFDTAHIYAAWIEGGWGASERTVGEWIRTRGVRDQIVLATKGGHPPLDDMKHGRCGKADLDSDLSESLERLGVDHIDLYWLHRDDPSRGACEVVETLTGFVKDGRIRAIGGSNWEWFRLENAIRSAEINDLTYMAASQPGWALATPKPNWAANIPGIAEAAATQAFMDEPTRQKHIETGFPAVPYSAQAQGYFGEDNVAWARGGFSGETPRGAHHDWDDSRAKLLRAIELADAKGVTTNQIALAYLLCQPFPVYPIVGTGNAKRIPDMFGALELQLTAAECDYLREGNSENC